MCFDFKTSILSYSIGMISAIVALCTNQIILGMLILFYTQMQLSEAIIWKGIENKNISWNQWGTLYGQYLLPTHNLAIAFGILIVYGNSEMKNCLPVVFSIFFYLMICALYASRSFPDVTYPVQNCFQKECGFDKNRLLWPFPTRWYTISFFFSLLLLILYIKPRASQIFLGIFFLFTFFLIWIIYPVSMSSMWCFSTAIIAPFLVFINYFLTH